MKRILFSVFIFLGVPIFTQAAFFVAQESVFEVDTWRDLETAQTYYGELEGFPHTFEFLVKQSMVLPIRVSVQRGEDPVSLMVVREVTRGVEEAGRQMGDREDWEAWKDGRIGMRFDGMESQELQLEPGIHRLEISSAENKGRYRLDVGSERESVGYFGAIKETLVVHNFFGTWITGVFTWRIFFPTLFIVCLGYYFYIRRRHQKHA